jgi:8-oxo-dGTP diphosphatase
LPKKQYVYDWPRASNTADVIVHVNSYVNYVLVIRRKHEPFKDLLALPGGFWQPGESLAGTASRELAEETGVIVPAKNMIQLGTYSSPKRDPRGPVISTVFVANIDHIPRVKGFDDAKSADFYPLLTLLLHKKLLAFDHAKILMDYYKSLKGRL